MLYVKLIALCANVAAAMPLAELDKRTDGKVNLEGFYGASCENPTGDLGWLEYGKTVTFPASKGMQSVQYNAKHTGDSVKSVQICVHHPADGVIHCKSRPPSEPFCFTPGGSITSVEAIGIKN